MIIDTSVYRDFVMEELRLITSDGSFFRRAIPIHETDLQLRAEDQRSQYFDAPNADIVQLAKRSWPYYSASEDSLKRLWQHVVSRAGDLIAVDNARSLFLDTPNKWWLNASGLVQRLNKVRAFQDLSLHLSETRFKEATQAAVVTHRRRTERSGQRFPFPAPATPWRRSSGNTSELPVPGRPAKTHRGGAAGWSLFAAFEPGGRGSRGALGALCTTGTDRGGL